MDGADPQRWSAVAADWAELWGDLARPVWRPVVAATGMGAGSRVLDVGCGSGDFLAHLDHVGVSTAGIDPAAEMVVATRSRVTTADVRMGSVEHLPWRDRSFDVVTAFNALQFAVDDLDAVAEMMRVTVPAGFVVIANWAEDARNDLAVIEAAVAQAAGDDVAAGGPLRQPGGLEELLHRAGLDTVLVGLVDVPWDVPDEDALLRGVLLGEDPATMAATAPVVLRAAAPFRTPRGGYRLVNAFRYAIARTSGSVPA